MGGLTSKDSGQFGLLEGPREMILKGHGDSVFCAAYSPDGKRLATGGADRLVLIWDAVKGKQRKSFSGHTGHINSIQYSPTGSVLASGSEDKLIILWDLKNGVKLKEFPAEKSALNGRAAVNAIAFSENGRYLASAHGSPRENDNSIRIWDVKGGVESLDPLIGHASIVTSVAYCDEYIASGSFDGMVKIWNASNGELRHSLRSMTGMVLSVALSPDGMFLAAGEGCGPTCSARPSIMIWETNRGVPSGHPLVGHTASIRSLAYSADGTRLISGAEDGTVRVWSPNPNDVVGHKAATITGHLAMISSVAFSPDQQWLCSASEDKTARILSLMYTPRREVFKKERCADCRNPRRLHHDERLSCLPYVVPHLIPDFQASELRPAPPPDDDPEAPDGAADGDPAVTALSVRSDDADAAAAAAADAADDAAAAERMSVTIGKEEDIPAGAPAPRLPPPRKRGLVRQRSEADSDDIFEIAAGPDPEHPVGLGRRAADADAAGGDGEASDAAEGGEGLAEGDEGGRDEEGVSVVFEGHGQAALSVAYNPDGRTVVTGGGDGRILMWDVVKGRQRAAGFAGHADAVLSLAYSPRGDVVASGSADETAMLWDARTGRRLREPLLGHSDRVWSVAFSPGGDTLVTAGGDALIILWDVATGQPRGYPLEGHADWVGRAVFSPDGRSLASGGGDRTVRVWDADEGEQALVVGEHADAVYAVAYSPDGALLASGSRDRTVRLWPLGEGAGPPPPPLEGHAEAVLAICFVECGPAGLLVASASYDKTLVLWSAADGAALFTLRGHRMAVVAVCCSDDGALLASASLDGTMRLWVLDELFPTSGSDTGDDEHGGGGAARSYDGADAPWASARSSQAPVGGGRAPGGGQALGDAESNVLRIGGFVSIAASRLARAGAERASSRALDASTAEMPAGARRKVKAGLIAVQAVGRLARAGRIGRLRRAGSGPAGGAILEEEGGAESGALTGPSPAEDERLRAVRMWYDCAAKAAAANDLGPALQLAEFGLANCNPADVGHAAETALLQAIHAAIRRAAARSRDPDDWGPQDAADFLRLATANPGLALRKPMDGRLLVQLAAAPEQLVRWVGGDADPEAIRRAAAQLLEIAAVADQQRAVDGAAQSEAGSFYGGGGSEIGGGPQAGADMMSYEVVVGPNTYEMSLDNPAVQRLGTLAELKRAIVEHIGDPEVLADTDEFRLVRVDVQSGREIAVGQNTRAMEQMILQGRRPVLKVVNVRHSQR